MLNALLISSIYVLDQDKALDFYVGKLGLESIPTKTGFMRWLTVNVRATAARSCGEAGRPGARRKAAEQVRELVSKGATGGTCSSRCHCRRPTKVSSEGRGVYRGAHGATLRDRLRCAIIRYHYDSRSRRRCPRRSQVPRRATVRFDA